MFPIDVLRFSEFRTMRNHLSETLMLNDIQITSDYMSRWVVLKRRVGAVTSQRVLKVLFYVNILQCFFVVENFTANAVSVAIGDNGNRLIFEIWWNFFCDLFSIKNVADVNSIDSNTSSNITYKPASFDKDEILANHRSFMTSLNIPSGKESEDLPYLYWIPKLHKTPYKERYIAGSSTCSTKELSIHLTKILSAVKEGQQKYCETVYSRSGINHMWILKNSKDLLDNLKSRSFSQVSSIKTFDFSTLYTTLPHDKLKTRLKDTIHKAFSHRNYGSKFVVLGYNSTYFSNKIHKGKTCYSEEQVISMLEFLIDNIFVSFGGTLFQQVVGIPMGTNCAPLLADLFLYSYESEFLQKLVKDKKIHEARAFNFTYRYIDDVLSINNSRFAEFLPLIYPPELEVKETTDTASSASFWTYTSNLTTVVNSVLKFMISGTTSILKS